MHLCSTDHFVIFLLVLYAFFSTISIRIIDLTMTFGLLLMVWTLFRQRALLRWFNIDLIRYNGLFLFVCALSIITAYKPILAINKTWGIFFDMVPLFLILLFVRTQRQIQLLLWGLLGSLSISSIYTIYQGVMGHPRAAGFMIGHPPQGMAGFLVLLVLYFFVLTTKGSSFFLNMSRWLVPVLLLANAAFLFNGTRGAWLSLIVMLCVFSTIHLRSQRKVLAGILVGVLTIGLLFAVLPQFESLRNRFLSATKISMQNPDSERIYKWQMATALFLDHPLLGVGLDNYISIPDFDRYLPAQARERQPSNAHNIFFHILAETGILGLCSFMAMFGYIILYCWRQYRSNPSNLLCLAALYATLGLLLYGQTEYITNDFTVMRLYWFLIGIAWQDSLLRQETNSI